MTKTKISDKKVWVIQYASRESPNDWYYSYCNAIPQFSDSEVKQALIDSRLDDNRLLFRAVKEKKISYTKITIYKE